MAVALLACMPSFAQSLQPITATENAVICKQSAAIPVALVPGQPASYKVSGELCATEDELRSETTVQLLIHGATYNRDYWDFGIVDRFKYSYAQSAARYGFPTFALDEIGSGNSSQPASDQITVQAAAYVAHQIVQGLRNGSIGGIRFGTGSPPGS